MAVSWHDAAACKGMPTDTFYPSSSNRAGYLAARRICMACPVRVECLNEALASNERYGIWGGLGPGQRWRLRATMQEPDKYTAGHGDATGTVKGFWREYAAGLEPCPDCRHAYNEAAKAKRIAKKCERMNV